MGWSEATITLDGIALVTELINGGKLKITRAEISENTVDATALALQKTVQSPLNVPVVIAQKEKRENSLNICVQIHNTGAVGNHRMRQLGLYAQTETSEEKLFALLQNGFGEEIPPEDEYPQFLLEFTAVITVSNADNISVAIEPASVIVTKAMLNSALADKADRSELPTTLPANGGNADTVNGHTVNADVPVDAKFTDTKYTHPTTAGNKHIPAGGSSGQILKWAADGTAVWGADNNTTYSAMTGATASAAGKAGLVPAPPIGARDYYLNGSGAWSYPMMGSYIGGTNRDLNNYTSPKVLYFPYQSGDKNFPVSTSGWLMVITHGDPSWIKQIFFDLTSSNIYSRHRINGSWEAWSKYISVSPTVNPLQIVNIVQGTRNGLSGNQGIWYVSYQSGATKALVEVWETITETSNVAKTLYGSRYLTGISSSMTATTATAVITSAERTVMVGTDTVGRITFGGSISLDTNYRVTWLV